MQLTLEELKEALICFSPNQSDGWKENCIVALESQDHSTGCVLQLNGDFNESIVLNWNSEFKRSGYKEPKKYTEKGAEALSFFIAVKYTDYDVVEESTIGTGIDYWLGYNENHEKYDDYQLYHARLEISGILKESKSNNLEKRVAQKVHQTDTGDTTYNHLPAYVSVIEFSNPRAHFFKK